MVGAGRPRGRAADDHPRRVDREHRAPVGAGGPRHQQRRPAVDGHGVHPGLRRTAAAGWADRRLHRPQAHLHHRPDRVRRRLGHRRSRAQPGAAVRRARPPGRLRGPDGARRPVHRDGHVHRAEGARQGVRRVRCARRRRRRDRPDRRRRAHRVRLVALVPRGQRARRPDRGGGGGPARPREQGARRHQVRRPGRPAGHGRPVLAGLRLHRGRPGRRTPTTRSSTDRAGLGRPEHADVPDRRGGAARRVRALGAPGPQPDAAAARRARPQPRRVVPGVPARGRRAVRDVPVPDLLLPGQPRLHAAEGRLRVPAVQPRHHPRRRLRVPAAPPRRSAGR